jgi:hypothetical protein
VHAEDPEATSLERQESLDAAFLEHLMESERRFSGARHSALDVLVGATIAVILVAGASLGIMHLRMTGPRDRTVVETSKPVSTPVAKPSVVDAEKDSRPSIDVSKPGRYTLKER